MSLILAWIAFAVYAWFAAAYLYALLINLRSTYLTLFLGYSVIGVAALISSYQNSALAIMFLLFALFILLGELLGYAHIRYSTAEYAHHRDIILFRKPVKPLACPQGGSDDHPQ
jgi:hypothetical protein